MVCVYKNDLLLKEKLNFHMRLSLSVMVASDKESAGSDLPGLFDSNL